MVNKGVGSVSDIRKKLSHDHELIATCYHEAGHTISGLLNFLFISVVGIEITQDKRSKKDLGYTHFESYLDEDRFQSENLIHQLLISEIYINYAGLAAEKILYKDICGTDKLPMVLKAGSHLDRDRVSEIIKKNNLAPPGKKRHLFKKKLFSQTQKTLEKYWGDVKLISHALFNRKKLYFADLKQILTKKSKNKIFWKQQIKYIECIFDTSYSNDDIFVSNLLSNNI